MNYLEVTTEDQALIAQAQNELAQPKQHDWHRVACALRLTSGKVYTSSVLESEVSSLTVCAEPLTISKALNELTNDPAQLIVAVRISQNSNLQIIPPCGRCREFILDYCPKAHVILHDTHQDKLIKVAAQDLLPFRYCKAE